MAKKTYRTRITIELETTVNLTPVQEALINTENLLAYLFQEPYAGDTFVYGRDKIQFESAGRGLPVPPDEEEIL